MKVWIEYYKSGTAAFSSSSKVRKTATGDSFETGRNVSSLTGLIKSDLKDFLDREGILIDEAVVSYLYEIDL